MLEVEHAMLAERFQTLLDTERRAEQVYADLIDQMSDPAARQQVEQIYRHLIGAPPLTNWPAGRS